MKDFNCEKCQLKDSEEIFAVAMVLSIVNFLLVSADVTLYFFSDFAVHLTLFCFHGLLLLLMVLALTHWWRLRRKEKWREKLDKIASAGRREYP